MVTVDRNGGMRASSPRRLTTMLSRAKISTEEVEALTPVEAKRWVGTWKTGNACGSTSARSVPTFTVNRKFNEWIAGGFLVVRNVSRRRLIDGAGDHGCYGRGWPWLLAATIDIQVVGLRCQLPKGKKCSLVRSQNRPLASPSVIDWNLTVDLRVRCSVAVRRCASTISDTAGSPPSCTFETSAAMDSASISSCSPLGRLSSPEVEGSIVVARTPSDWVKRIEYVATAVTGQTSHPGDSVGEAQKAFSSDDDGNREFYFSADGTTRGSNAFTSLFCGRLFEGLDDILMCPDSGVNR
ncbi:hypothetical protein MMC07_004626 [Pseudocyphellaria aurata]|nr:hypothetical protein [Pseudocyphellaria aurata]